MPFKINNEALYPLYNMPHTQLAIEYCVKVVELWPLQTAQEMENDAKYMEDLQVGFSCMMARYSWRSSLSSSSAMMLAKPTMELSGVRIS